MFQAHSGQSACSISRIFSLVLPPLWVSFIYATKGDMMGNCLVPFRYLELVTQFNSSHRRMHRCRKARGELGEGEKRILPTVVAHEPLASFPQDSWFCGPKGFTDVFSLSLYIPPIQDIGSFSLKQKLQLTPGCVCFFCSTRKTDLKEGIRVTMLALGTYVALTLLTREREFAPCAHSSLSIYPPFLLCIRAPIFINRICTPYESRDSRDDNLISSHRGGS